MSEHDDPIESLLASERGAPGMPDDVSARLASRLGLPLPGGGGGGGDPSGGAPSASAPSAGSAATGSTAATSAASAWSAMRGAQLALVFLLGGASGVALDRMLVTEPVLAPQTVVAEEPHAPPPLAVAPTVAPAVEAPAPLVAQAAAPVVRPARPSDEAESSDAERLWLERAEAAFGTGDATAALSALDAHARRFPRGSLSEERDALRVRALYLAGRNEEADRRAESFAAAHPGSVFVRQIERARERAEAAQTHSPETDP